MVNFGIFTSNMNSCKASKCYFYLILFRLIAFVVITFILFFFLYPFWAIDFAYLTNIGILITIVFFGLSIISYVYSGVDKAACIFFLIAWTFNWCITIIFWAYIYPLSAFNDEANIIVRHTVPVILTTIDFIMNKISFLRIQYIFPIGSLIIYLLCILLPITLTYGPIYIGINFRNAITYIMCLVVLIVAIIFLELGKLIKRKLFSA